MTTASLPAGTSSLDRACAGHGWHFVAKARTAWGWSPESGWRVLPSAPWKIEALDAVADGFLATLESGRAVGLWAPGDAAWRWWLDPRACTSGNAHVSARWRADGSLLALQASRGGGEECVLLRIGRESPERLRWFHLEGLGDLRGIEDRGDDPARILCANGIAAVPLRSGRVELERWVPVVGDEARVVGRFVLEGPERYRSNSPLTRVIDLERGTLGERPWPAGPGFRALQEAAARGEKDRLRGLIQFLAVLPPQPGSGDEILAILEGSAGPVAAAKVAGVQLRSKGDEAGGGLSPGSPLRRSLLPLALLADPEEAAPLAAVEILEGRSGGAELAFSDVFGEGAGRTLAAALRGMKELKCHDPGDVRRLFGRLGQEARGLVMELLAEDDSAGRLLGAIAAGEPLVDLAPSLSGVRRGHGDSSLRERFLATLRHPDAAVRTAALESCAALRLSGVAAEVDERFRNDDTTVRAAAAAALLRLDDSGERERATLSAAMGFEEQRVRIEIVEGLRCGWRAGDVDILLPALGDPSDRVRYEAFETFGERFAELDTAAVQTALDAWLLTAVGNRTAVASGKPRMPMDSGSFAATLGESFAAAEPPEPELELPRTISTLVALLVLGPVLEAVSTSEEWSGLRVSGADFDGEAVEWLDRVAPGVTPLLPAILAVGREKGSADSLAALSNRLAASWPDHADRAAIAALLKAREERRRGETSTTPAPENLSLAARLSRLGRTESGLPGCVRRVRERSREKGPVGLAALLVLALGGDADSQRELLRRVETGEVGPWWSAATAFAQASDDEERVALARRVARSRAIPPGRKGQLLEALEEMDTSLALVDDPAHAEVAEEIALARGALPLVRRARTSWLLGKAGRIAPLEALWKELDDDDPTAAIVQYEVALGLARTGQADRLDVVRGRWLGDWDARVVDVLEKHGDERDLPDLEKAKERHAPAAAVDAAITAIRARAGKA